MSGRRGASFIEIIVSLLIVSIAAMMLFSVATFTVRTQASLEAPAAMEISVQGLSRTLGNYVADVAPGRSLDPSWGPGGSWALPGDDSSCRSYALDSSYVGGWKCEHNATSFLSPAVLKDYPKAALTYTVTTPYGPEGPREVEFSLKLK